MVLILPSLRKFSMTGRYAGIRGSWGLVSGWALIGKAASLALRGFFAMLDTMIQDQPMEVAVYLGISGKALFKKASKGAVVGESIPEPGQEPPGVGIHNERGLVKRIN